MNHLRRECYERGCWEMRRTTGRISNLSVSATRNFGEPGPYLSHRLNSLPSELLSKRNVIRLFSSFINLDDVRSLNRRRRQVQIQSRPQSSSTGDRVDHKTSLHPERETNSIPIDATGFSMLEEAAFASKEIVQRRLLNSVETAVWKSSTATERKKMYRFFYPQLQKATEGLLEVTRDVEVLTDLITKASENTRHKTTAEISLRGLHSSFLQLTQMLLDNFDVAIESERNQSEASDDDSSHSLCMLELVLSLSYRANMLGLGYHWPLYQRLALAVARHPKTIDDIKPSEPLKTLGLLGNQSRAEWIQTIHRWSRFTWSSDNKQDHNQASDDGSEIERKQEDLTWFHPALKVLAEDGHWNDVYQILVGVLRPDLDSNMPCNGYNIDGIDGKAHNNAADIEDDIILSTPINVPYLNQDIVLDLLVPMEKQGLLRDLWKTRRLYPPTDSIVENIIFMMEVSIWKIFYSIPSHMKAKTRHEDIDYSITYGLRDAIGTLLKCGPSNLNERHTVYDTEREYLSDNEEEDSLVKALSELEDILDEHLDLSKDQGAGNEINHSGSDAIALATALANETSDEGDEGDQIRSSGYSSFLNPENVPMPSNKTEDSIGYSYGEHVMERTSLDETSHLTDNILNSIDGEEYLDFIYDDRAADYEDNLPDVTKQIYQHNGNQQLRYSTALEYHIFEGLHRPNLHYDDEDDFEF